MTDTLSKAADSSAGIMTMSTAIDPTMTELDQPRRCSAQRVDASLHINHWLFVRRASSNRLQKNSSRPKAWIVSMPERISSKMWNMGLFVTIHQRMASLFVRRWISRTVKKQTRQTNTAGAARGRVAMASAKVSTAFMVTMHRTSSMMAAVQSTVIWSSPNLFITRPDGVRSKKAVGQRSTRCSILLCVLRAARRVRQTHDTREFTVSTRPKMLMAIHSVMYHSAVFRSRSPCQTARNKSGKTSAKWKLHEQRTSTRKAPQPPMSRM
mmetsp:Transcript_84835/g.262640  ORF Transcript_84835/g.262640 Transcript_84835/m.262640 type:complete len:267 (-) Transcript_84835:150-950(-)